MDKHTASTAIATIGIDLAKNVFKLHGIDASGKVVNYGDGVDGAHPASNVP